MFKHILLPTDGSEASQNAIRAGITFAKEAGATVIGLYVIPEFHVLAYEASMLVPTEEEFIKNEMTLAETYLAEIKRAAENAAVKYETVYVTSDYPYEEIIKVAENRRCDLIMMASHGRKGVKGFLIGSETQKVLTHSKIPVLVLR
jgi:nucleotide-binding universal stress UspA family protein